MFFFQNAIAFEEKEEQKFNRSQFKCCFTELSKLIREVSQLKSNENDEEVNKSAGYSWLIHLTFFFVSDQEKNNRKSH